MATRESTAQYILDQVSGAGTVRIRKMFGEYALYCDEKVVALICDDRFFLKPTEQGREIITNPEEAPPYPGSKPFWVIEEDRWEDREWLCEVVRITADALPTPKPKKPKKLKKKK